MNSAVGRVQSESDVFATPQQEVERARATIEAEHARLNRSPELQPYFQSNPTSPSLAQARDADNPFAREPLQDFGGSLMDLDEADDAPWPTSQSTVDSGYQSVSYNPRKKRKEVEEDEDEGEMTDPAEEEEDDSQMTARREQRRVFKPVRRSLGKTQSL
jgi:hypothetical protein